MIVKLSKLFLFIFLTSLFFSGCTFKTAENNGSESGKKQYEFKDGINCFSYTGEFGNCYIKFDIQGEDFDGILYYTDPAWGEAYVEFDGTRENDTTFDVFMHEYDGDVNEEWVIRTVEDKIMMAGFSYSSGDIVLTPVSRKDLPDIKSYASVDDIENEIKGEMYESAIISCYYKYYPEGGGAQRIRLAEYIKIRDMDEVIEGLGAGYSEGENDWSMHFNGTMTNDSTYDINASYQYEGGYSFETKEIWVINREDGMLYVKEITPETERAPGNPFHKIDCDNIESWAEKLMSDEETRMFSE